MNAVADGLGRLARAVLKIAVGLALAVFVVSLLLASVLVVLGVSVWSLITGRKPAPVVMFTQMRERSQRMAQGVWPNGAQAARGGEVVDVQAREVDDVAPERGPRRP